MTRFAVSLFLLACVLNPPGVTDCARLHAQEDEEGPELSLATKATPRKATVRQVADPPPEFLPSGAEVEFGGWGRGAWSAEGGEFATSDADHFGQEMGDEFRPVPRHRPVPHGPGMHGPGMHHPMPQQSGSRHPTRRPRNVRPIQYQERQAVPGQEPVDVGNIPVPGAEEDLGPTTERAKRYQQHAIMYDDAEQANARKRTIQNFHSGRPTNNNNEFGDFAYDEPTLNGPDLPRAGFYGYGPSHDSCFGSGRCGRDAICCGDGGCGLGSCGGCGLGNCGGCGEGCEGGCYGDDCCGPPDCGSCDTCGSCCSHGSSWWENLTVAGGVQGFKSPIDLGRNGNFGLREGINWGAPVWQAYGIGGQIGINALQSSLSGNNVAGSSSSARSQIFVTAGLFRRALLGQHWQGGIAYDYLRDDYYINTNLNKIRGELSYVVTNSDDIGSWVSIGLDDTGLFGSIFSSNNLCWTANDLYAFFWRRTLSNGTVGRAWAGFSGSGDGMLGGELRIPFSNHWALEADANYLIPESGSDHYGAGTEEAWNVAIGIAWYPGNAYSSTFSPWRPLFGVADNSIFPYTRK